MRIKCVIYLDEEDAEALARRLFKFREASWSNTWWLWKDIEDE